MPPSLVRSAVPCKSSVLSRLSYGVARFSRTNIFNATHRDMRPIPSFASKVSGGRRRGPWRGFTEPFDNLPSNFLFYAIIAVNACVFAVWQYASIKYHSTGSPDLVLWMRDNFTVSWRNVKQGRFWTVIASCFSHKDIEHVFMNGLTFFFMAPTVLRMLGNARFLALYFGGGIISSLTSLSWNKRSLDYSSHGASGAIYAVISFFACVAPNTRFLIFFVIPCPAWAFVGGVFLFDSYGAITGTRQGTDTAGHVGGLLAGIAYFLFRARFRF